MCLMKSNSNSKCVTFENLIVKVNNTSRVIHGYPFSPNGVFFAMKLQSKAMNVCV